MHYQYYRYCTSLIFEFWQEPLQVDYRSLVHRLGAASCAQCQAHSLGSVLYVTALAALGTLAKVIEIHLIIGNHGPAPSEDKTSFRRDVGLMASTLSMIVYLVLFLGVIFVEPLLFVPWIIFQLLYIAQALSNLLLLRKGSNLDVQLFALMGINIVQVLCVFLGFHKA